MMVKEAPPKWLVEGMLPASRMSMVYGVPESYKSFWALDWALCIATYRKWNGLKVAGGPVLYVAGEAEHEYPERCRAWARKHHVEKVPGWHLWPAPVPLWPDSCGVDSLIEQCRQQDLRPALVVFDSLSSCMGGGNGDESDDSQVALNNCERICKQLGAAVLLIHHPGWSDTHLRGSSAWRAGVSMLGKLERPKGKDMIATLTCEKLRGARHFEPITRTLYPVKGVVPPAEERKHGPAACFADGHYAMGPRPAKVRVSWEAVRDALAVDQPIMPATLAARHGWHRKVVQAHLNRHMDEVTSTAGAYSLNVAAVAA
jgi:hypothetical protein